MSLQLQICPLGAYSKAYSLWSYLNGRRVQNSINIQLRTFIIRFWVKYIKFADNYDCRFATIMFFPKCSIVVCLLVTLSIAIPSPTEENKDTTRHGTYIENLTIVINCYLNSDSPECNNTTADARGNGESETTKEENKSNDKNGSISLTANLL